jgi:hypothetical protein
MSDERRIADLTTATTLTDNALFYAQEPFEADPELADKKISKTALIDTLARTSFAEKISTLLFGTSTPALKTGTTVNFTTAQTAAEKQALINAQPVILNGYTLLYQFENGTHNHNAALTFPSVSGGRMVVRGNTSDNTSSLTKSVTINMGANNAPAFSFQYCNCPTELDFLKIIGTGWASVTDLVIYGFHCQDLYINAVAIDGTDQGRVLFQRCKVNTRFLYIKDLARGINVEYGTWLGDGAGTYDSNLTDFVIGEGGQIVSSQASATVAKSSGGIVFLNGVLS